MLVLEASRLTARDHLTVLGGAGVWVEAMSSDPFALCRWSRWTRHYTAVLHLHRPGRLPGGGECGSWRWAGSERCCRVTSRHGCSRSGGTAPAQRAGGPGGGSFGRVQSKAAFARLLDELGGPRPRWWLVRDETTPRQIPACTSSRPFFGTAARGVRPVQLPGDGAHALAELRTGGQERMAQAAAPRQYGQVQALLTRADWSRRIPMCWRAKESAGAPLAGSPALQRHSESPAGLWSLTHVPSGRHQ